ncbi:MAG: J domain-containing protein [Chloroflexi bacterium]|nr:J domain-containing protein [Chloroflexota bacterium]
MTTPAPQNPPLDPYAVLGLSQGTTATLDEIKQAYFTLVRAYPPEREPEAFKRIRAAYDRLKTPEKKLETDMTRLEPWPEPELQPPAPLDLSVSPADVICAARALSDLSRTDWREDFHEVRL